MRVVSTRVLPLPAPARISARRVRQRDGGELFGIEVFEEVQGIVPTRAGDGPPRGRSMRNVSGPKYRGRREGPTETLARLQL